jgi:predicted cation transporter
LILLIFQLTFNSYITLKSNTEISTLVVPASIGYVANLIGFGLVFYILLKDIFSQKHDLTYSLLGASNIYFMIPMIFCYIYSLIAVHNPAMVNADPLAIKTVLFNCMDYSWYVLAGIDYPGEKIGEQLQTIAILESITANLFIVFIIGRLMSK